MPLPIPHDWLMATTLAWPLVSEAALLQRITVLGRRAMGMLDRPTQALADELDSWLRPRAGGVSLEALRSMREASWFAEAGQHTSLAEHTVRIAAHHLCSDGTRVVLRLPRERTYQQQVNRWHWLCRALPPDLLIAALACHERIVPLTDTVQPCSPDVARVLEQEVAETHLHVGAAIPFPVLWTGLMARPDALDARDSDGKLSRGGAPPFGSPQRFIGMLTAAATARFVLAGFLQWRENTGENQPFSTFWQDRGQKLCERAAGPAQGTALAGWIRCMLRLLCAAAPAPDLHDLAHMRRAYRQLVTPVLAAGMLRRTVEPFDTNGDHDTDHDIASRDPLSAWLPAGAMRALPETRFACHALGYLAGAGRTGHGDTEFALLFWQYQRVRGICFGHVVQEPGTHGLDWFSRHFDRIAALREPIDNHKYRIALDTQSRGVRLASLEARTAPGDSWERVWREIRSFARQARAWMQRPHGRPAEIGLVLHFVKEHHCRPCRRLHADPRHAFFNSRYGHWYYKARLQAEAITRVLAYAPESLLILRGLDIANVELAVPAWVTVPLFHDLRRRSGEAARILARRYPGLAAEPLRATYHAGEDYRRLAEGLRRVHELIEHDVLVRGDRIGHGLALGEPPEAAAERGPLVFQPADDRLDDLVWEWERYARGEVVPPPGRETSIAAEITRLARDVYCGPRGPSTAAEVPRIDELAVARQLRHDPGELDRLGYPSCREPSGNGPRHLLWRYLTDAGVFVRGQIAVEVQASPAETRALTELQAWLRDQVAARAITVESNPTSNLVITDLRDVTQHPSFVLQPLGINRQGAIPLSINTDNPLTFSTCLADEYTYLYAALLREGVCTQDAIDWLERARRAGWRSRFTLAASAEAECLEQVQRALAR